MQLAYIFDFDLTVTNMHSGGIPIRNYTDYKNVDHYSNYEDNLMQLNSDPYGAVNLTFFSLYHECKKNNTPVMFATRGPVDNVLYVINKAYQDWCEENNEQAIGLDLTDKDVVGDGTITDKGETLTIASIGKDHKQAALEEAVERLESNVPDNAILKIIFVDDEYDNYAAARQQDIICYDPYKLYNNFDISKENKDAHRAQVEAMDFMAFHRENLNKLEKEAKRHNLKTTMNNVDNRSLTPDVAFVTNTPNTIGNQNLAPISARIPISMPNYFNMNMSLETEVKKREGDSQISRSGKRAALTSTTNNLNVIGSNIPIPLTTNNHLELATNPPNPIYQQQESQQNDLNSSSEVKSKTP